MKFTTSETRSQYHLLPGQQEELTHWFDLVLAASEPEDVTGTIFIDNFIRDDKAHRPTANGLVTAILRRFPYEDPTLSDVVIENDELHETNAEKGILFDVSDPVIGNYYSQYQVQLVQEGFSHPRYNGRAFLHATPSHLKSNGYGILLRRQLHWNIKSISGDDSISYFMPTNTNTVDVMIAIDPLDAHNRTLRRRALTAEELETNSLREHAQFIAGVIGIRPPEFLS